MYGTRLDIVPGDGLGGFDTVLEYDIPEYIDGVSAADLNADGWADLVLTAYGHVIELITRPPPPSTPMRCASQTPPWAPRRPRRR